MSTTDHNFDDREVTKSLIDLSEIVDYVTENKTKASKTSQSVNDWADDVVGWRRTFGFPVKASNTGIGNVRKKRTVERSVTDLHYGGNYSNQNQSDDYWSNGSSLSDQKPAIRCVGDDSESFPIPPWKSNIEQGTCRYVHDNGSYRTLKFMYDDRKDWYTMRKKRPEKVSATWHHTCKRMQREMKRQLKKDLALAERDREKSNDSKSGLNSARYSLEPTSGEETTTSSRMSTEENKSERHTPQKLELFVGTDNKSRNKETPGLDQRPTSFEFNGKSLHRKETRVKSTHSDGAVNQTRKMKTIHESEPVTPVPHYSIPSGSQMLKSASDLFIENFSSKISALEDEIKKDSKWLRKNENDLTKLQSSRAKYRDVSRNFKESSMASITPRGPIKTEPLTSDIFSVKPMTQKEVKPLENIKSSTIKSINTSQNGDRIHETYGSHPNRNNYNTNSNGFNYNAELDKGPSSYKASDDNSKYTLFNTLTGTKINTQNNKKTSKGFSTPSTITICDNSLAGNTSQLNDKTTESLRQIPSINEKKLEKKGTLQNIPALLPEISGKSEPVQSSDHSKHLVGKGSTIYNSDNDEDGGDMISLERLFSSEYAETLDQKGNTVGFEKGRDSRKSETERTDETQNLPGNKKVRFYPGTAEEDALKEIFSDETLLEKKRKSFNADMKIFSKVFDQSGKRNMDDNES